MGKRKLLMCVALSSLLIGCGGSDDDDGDAGAANADLQGTWLGECEVDGEDSIREEITYDGNSATQSLVTYALNTECDSAFTVNINVPATFTVDGSTTDLADGTTAKNLDLVISPGNYSASAASIQALEAAGTTLEASAAAAGFSDINNIPLANLGLNQPELFLIYRVDGNQLLLGDTEGGLDGSSADLRPNSFDPEIFNRL